MLIKPKERANTANLKTKKLTSRLIKVTYEGPIYETFKMKSYCVSLSYSAKFMYNTSEVWIRDACIFRQIFFVTPCSLPQKFRGEAMYFLVLKVRGVVW